MQFARTRLETAAHPDWLVRGTDHAREQRRSHPQQCQFRATADSLPISCDISKKYLHTSLARSPPIAFLTHPRRSPSRPFASVFALALYSSWPRSTMDEDIFVHETPELEDEPKPRNSERDALRGGLRVDIQAALGMSISVCS